MAPTNTGTSIPFMIYKTVFANATSTCIDYNLTSSWTITSSNDTSYSYSNVYPVVSYKIDIKKALKRLIDTMSKEGWIEHEDHYLVPKVIPISLRGVRLDGRGWANL